MEEYIEPTEEKKEIPSRKREDYFRCKVCKMLWADNKCVQDPIKGFICPNGCEKPYIQDEYELPTQD